MNVVDSSGWIEYLAGGPNADFFREPIEDHEKLLVPVLSLFEDSIMLATARVHGADFWTQDADFEGLEGVRWRRKP